MNRPRGCQTARRPTHRRILRGAIDLEFEHRGRKRRDTVALDGFRKHGLRIEPGDEGLGADIMRDHAGGDANGTIGPEDDAGCRQPRSAAAASRDPFQPTHTFLPQPSDEPGGF